MGKRSGRPKDRAVQVRRWNFFQACKRGEVSTGGISEAARQFGIPREIASAIVNGRIKPNPPETSEGMSEVWLDLDLVDAVHIWPGIIVKLLAIEGKVATYGIYPDPVASGIEYVDEVVVIEENRRIHFEELPPTNWQGVNKSTSEKGPSTLF